jgi:hypothetical protein
MRNFSPWRMLAPVAIAALSCSAAAQSDTPADPRSSQATPSSPPTERGPRLDNRIPGASPRGDRNDAVPRDPTTPDGDNGNGLGSDNDAGSNAQAEPQAPENPANPPAPVFPANPKRPADPGQPGNPVTPTAARVT